MNSSSKERPPGRKEVRVAGLLNSPAVGMHIVNDLTTRFDSGELPGVHLRAGHVLEGRPKSSMSRNVTSEEQMPIDPSLDRDRAREPEVLSRAAKVQNQQPIEHLLQFLQLLPAKRPIR